MVLTILLVDEVEHATTAALSSFVKHKCGLGQVPRVALLHHQVLCPVEREVTAKVLVSEY